MIAVRDHLASSSATIVIVTFGAEERLAVYRQHLSIPFAVLSDPTRGAYRDYEIPRGSVRAVYGIGTLRMYASLLGQGRKMRRPSGDTLQLGGDFVIDRDGRVAAAFYPKAPDERPTIAQLAKALATT